MEDYHKNLKKLKVMPNRHMFGGYQLLQKLSTAEAESRLEKMTKLWSELRYPSKSDSRRHVIHVESGHFSNTQIYELYVKYAVENADSLGMNEQELNLLTGYWKGHITNVNHSQNQ